MTRPSRLPVRLGSSWVLVLAILLPADGSAQDAWRSRVEFGYNGSAGNSSFSILRAGASTKHTRTTLFELDLSLVVRYGKNEERVIADDARASVKFDWRPEAVFSPFVFVDASRDEIRRLDFQAYGGIGAKWTFARTETSETSISAAGIFDHQNFAVPPGSEGPESEGNARWSFRFKTEKSFGEGATFEHVSFWQPVWNDVDDYTVEITNTLSTNLLGSLSLAVEHVYLRDAVPPPGAERDDQKYSVLLRLQF